MTIQSSQGRAAAMDLADTCVFLRHDLSAQTHPKTGAFLRDAVSSRAFSKGFVLALFCAATAEDVHYPVWERHPGGEEILICISGRLSVEVRNDAGEDLVPLPARSVFVVPAGAWHRVVVHEQSVVIAITPRHGTVHDTQPG